MKMLSIQKEADIPVQHRDTPIGDLLRFHNLGQPLKKYESAQLLVAMCMDNRKQLNLPEKFAYIIRTGGA
ncbi:MAG: carbonic anhydrase, partial [Candidatus Margulisiibacteriota bacterium]